MTLILGPGPEYEKRKLPNTGYLAASSNRSDTDCVRKDKLEAALAARRERNGDRQWIAAPPPRPSLIVRLDLWWQQTSGDPAFWPMLLWLGFLSLVVAALITRVGR